MGLNKKFWKSRRVLVTGGSGFVGYNLASTLIKNGARVTILDNKPLPSFLIFNKEIRKKIKFVKGTVTSQQTIEYILKKDRIQTVFHLAAEAIVSRALENPAKALETNILGTWTLLEASRKLKPTEIVVASSDKAYGIHKKLPYKENLALQGKYPYECSKSCTDLIAQMYAHTYNLPVVIARSGNIYGGGDMNGSRLIPDSLRSLFLKKPFVVRSNGKFLRDYIYISDIVNAYILLAEKLHSKKLIGTAFNFANNRPLSVIQVLEMIQKVSGENLKFSIANSIKHEIPDQYLDWSKAKKILNWRPRVSAEAGFRETANWYRDYFKNNGKLEL